MTRQTLPVIADCEGCGACCTEQGALPVHLTGERFRLPGVAPLPPELAAELLAALERFERDGWPPDGSPCIWFDREQGRCRHYAYRPALCRDEVLPGDDSCRRWRRLKGVDPQAVYRLRGGRVVRSVEKPEGPHGK